MQQGLYLFFVMLAALLVGCTGSGDTEDAVAEDLLQAGFCHTQGVADSLYNCMQFRDAYALYLQLLDSKEVKADSEKKLYVLNSLCDASELAGHKAEQTKWLEQLISLAKQTDNHYYHSMGLLTMGQNVFYEGDREHGIAYVCQAIDLMAKTDREDTDHLTHGFLIMLARLYGEMNDYDNALKINERNLQLTMEGTRWGNVPNLQLIDRRMALAKMASLLAQMKNFQRADSAYAAWKAVKYEGNHTRDYFIVDYMRKRGLYRETIPIYNDLIQRVRQQGDTLGEMMNTAKWGLAEVYQKMGNCGQAAILYEQVLEIQDTLKSRKAKNTAQELAAVYHAKEQEQTILQQEAENTRQRYILIGAISVLFAVTILAVVIICKNRIISRKNRMLAQQIAEAVNYKNKYWEEKRAQGPAASAPADLNTLSDEQLFQHINEVVIHERLFLDTRFGRQAIMDRFSLSKERVGTVFSKGSEHAKLNRYALQLRLDYAAHLLVDEPEKSVAEVAAESGFGSNTYFSDRFRQHFGISPTDFRREAIG